MLSIVNTRAMLCGMWKCGDTRGAVWLSAGVGVMMLLALTVERYVAVCHPGRTRPIVGPPRRVVALIPLLTFAAYLPAAFRARVAACRPALAPALGPAHEARVVYYKVSSGGAAPGDDPRAGHFAEERRLVLLLGSTSILFLVCVSPMVILNVTLSDRNLTLFPYQHSL
ncbi:Uncharacterized protein GBIM_21074 [Gryllus bimaculatus]|nr:Uncharacterized protein GBIM_21074 [Gryllus bimaculatus]